MQEELLKKARELADDVFRPRAEATDQGGIHGPIVENIRLLADAGYYGLGIDPQYGGMGADELTRREFTEIIASACGVTAFAQQQLHSGGSFVGNTENEELKLQLLPEFASGRNLCGIAFSHLRRPGPPMVHAERTQGGYRVNGKAPWVTGWSFLDSFVLGATLQPSGNHIYFYIPKSAHGDTLCSDPPMILDVMNASDTVEVEMHEMFVSDEHVLYERPAEALRQSDRCGFAGHIFLPLGCARGSVLYLRELAAKRNQSSLLEIAEAFSREIDLCRHDALAWAKDCNNPEQDREHAVRARSTTIMLAMRAAYAAVTATGGTAHLLSSPPQRLLREAIFYTTVAQTPDLRAGTLDMLVSK